MGEERAPRVYLMVRATPPQRGLHASEGPDQLCVAHQLLCNLRTEWLRTINVCYLGVDVWNAGQWLAACARAQQPPTRV